MKNTLLVLSSVAVSFLVVWLTSPWFYVPNVAPYYGEAAMPNDVRQELDVFYALWDDPEAARDAHAAMARENPEWDLISRTFTGYSLANVALQYPQERVRALRTLDRIIEDTVGPDELATEWRRFMLPYGNAQAFIHEPQRSTMVDGEIALLIGLRRLVDDPEDYKYRSLHARLVDYSIDAIDASPAMCAESYPDECWLFCTPMALAAIRVWDVLEGEDHTDLFRRWEAVAREKLVDPDLGLFKSAVTREGRVIHPPEGSTLWVAPYALEIVAPELAKEQYELMKTHLTGELACFRFGREWPRGKETAWDIDSGFTPFGMGPASTGFAMVASKELDDRAFFSELLGLVEFVGVPTDQAGQHRYRSSNLVGHSIFLLAKTTGPAWDEVKRRANEREGVL
jgi:hypothetical protein